MAKSGNYLLAQQMREEAWTRGEIAYGSGNTIRDSYYRTSDVLLVEEDHLLKRG